MVVFNSLFFAYKEAICSNKYKFTFITRIVLLVLFSKAYQIKVTAQLFLIFFCF